MPDLLSPLQLQRLEALELSLAPDVNWELCVDSADGILTRKIVWSSYPVQPEHRLLAQRLLLAWWSPAVVNGTASISMNYFRQADVLLRLVALANEYYPDKAFIEFAQSDWVHLAVLMVFRVWQYDETGKRRLVSTAQPLAVHSVERTLSLLKRWFDSYHDGDISDGPDYRLTNLQIENVLTPELRAFGIEMDDWKAGGSFGSVPFVVAHLLLADALDTLRSLRTMELLTYFSTVRDHQAHDLVESFWVDKKGLQLARYRFTGNAGVLAVSREAGDEFSTMNRAKTDLARHLDKRLRSLNAQHAPDKAFTFPWHFYSDLVGDYNKLQGALYIIFLSVMGKRGPSEVRTLRGIDITRPENATGQEALMRPNNQKTNKGLRQAQGVTNFIDEAFEVLLGLGYQDKTNTKLPLFSCLQSKKKPGKLPTRMSKEQAAKRLHQYYDAFGDRVAGKVDFDVRGLHGKLTSHQFRHSWAEFALRDFDDNVEELIRQHFCHRYNHWWTKRYTGDKLDSHQKNSINRAYVRELVPRIIYDNTDDPDFVGAIATFVKKDFTDRVSVLTPDQVEEHIELLCDEVAQLTAHEYGWCLLLKRYYNLAKCADENGNPDPSNTNAEKCSGCVNNLASKKSHYEKWLQIAINHIDFIEQDTFTLPRLKETSRNTVRNAQRMFPELNEYGKV